MTATTTSPFPSAERPSGSLLRDAWGPAVQRTAGLPFVARSALVAATDLVAAASAPGRTAGEHVHLANAYSVALAGQLPQVGELFEDPHGWLLPDGRPLVWVSALRHDDPGLHQVRGPQFMLDVADLGRAVGLRHYLLGGTPEVLRDLEANLIERFPGIEIVGSCSPAFRTATDDELCDRDDEIRATGAQVIWVGLGTPKQDVEAARLAASLPVVAVAVGAAFDYAAGSLRPAPHWVSVAGFEWLWRFAAEPKRLWKRYTVGNLQFLRAVARTELRALRERRRATPSRTAVVGQLPPPTHGSAVMTERLVEALRTNGELVSVVDRRFSRSVGEVGRFAVRKLLAIPSLVLRYLAAMRRAERLVLLITCTPASFLIDHLLLLLTRKPVVLYIHTVGFSALAGRGPVWRLLVRRTFARADRVVVLGASLVEDVAAFVPQERVAVVPNTTAAAPVLVHPSSHRVLFLSNLLPGKGADVFVRVARELVARRPELPWRFDLAGAGDPATLGALPDEVTVHGPVGGDEKRRLLEEADVLLVPSTYALEAQPLVIVEALSHGLPVVAYDNGGIRDLVDHSVGELVGRGDETALTEAVLDLLGSTKRRRSARTTARQRYERQHSPRAYAEAWRQVLPTRTAPLGGAGALR